MELAIDHQELAQALQNTARAVPSRTTLPVLSGVLLEALNGSFKMAATDLELGIECRANATIIEPGSLVLPSRQLTEIMRRIPGGRIEIKSDPSNQTARINWAACEFVIHGHEADQFPSLPMPGEETALSLPANKLREAVEGALFAASTDETRPILTGLQLTIGDGYLRALSTDGFRIAFRQVEAAIDGEGGASVVVPARSLGELARVIGGGEGTARLVAAANQMFCDYGSIRFVSRLLDGQYPAVLDLVPKSFSSSLRMSRQELHDACERVSILCDPLQKSYALSLKPEGDRLVLTASAASIGRAREEVSATLTGQPNEVIFNARYLAEGLRNCRGEEVVLELSGPVSAARLTSPSDPGFLYIIMPMRPSEG